MSTAEAVSLTSILGSLAQTPVPVTTAEQKKQRDKQRKTAEMQALSEEAKLRKVVEMRYQGFSVEVVAEVFGTSVRTIYRWLQQVNREFCEGFEGETAADLIAEHLRTLHRVEDACMYEATQAGMDGKEFDAKTGTVVDRKDRHIGKDIKLKCYSTVLKTRKMIIDLQLDTGILPRDPGYLYRTPAEQGKIDDDQKVNVSGTRSREQLISDVLDRLDKSRVLE